jgi:hypothetical protein
MYMIETNTRDMIETVRSGLCWVGRLIRVSVVSKVGMVRTFRWKINDMDNVLFRSRIQNS